MRYELTTRSWDGTEYLVIVDTETRNKYDEPRVICSEPVAFTVYPECAFIECVNDDSRDDMTAIVEMLNENS